MSLDLYGELLSKDSTYAPQGYIGALVKLDRNEEAWEVMNSLPANVSNAKRAMCYIHLNELDSTFKYLDIAFEERDDYMPFLKAEPHFRLIKEDPRYRDLLARMKLPAD